MVLLALPDGSPKIGHGDLWEWQGPEPVSATEVLKYMASQPPVEPRPDPKLVMSKSTLDLLDVAATANRRGSASMPDLLLLPTLFPANQSSRHVPENARRSRGPRPLQSMLKSVKSSTWKSGRIPGLTSSARAGGGRRRPARRCRSL